MKKIILTACLLTAVLATRSQLLDNASRNGEEEKTAIALPTQKENSGRLNLFVFTHEKKEKIDWMSFYTLSRARIKSFFHHKNFRVLRAKSSADAAMKIERIVKTSNKLIHNIWFDSHGHYGNRYSSFRIGTDQFSYKNIEDSLAIKDLQKIATWCDEKTQVGLGSCYAGADFYFPATDSTPACRMNGDSLMMGMGNIFKGASIFGCQSWVMAKPGIFKNRFGLAGYPLNKRFKDTVYAPVWERLGMWMHYSSATGQMRNISTIALDNKGNINVRARNYNSFSKSKRKIGNALKNLKHGVANFS